MHRILGNEGARPEPPNKPLDPTKPAVDTLTVKSDLRALDLIVAPLAGFAAQRPTVRRADPMDCEDPEYRRDEYVPITETAAGLCGSPRR